MLVFLALLLLCLRIADLDKAPYNRVLVLVAVVLVADVRVAVAVLVFLLFGTILDHVAAVAAVIEDSRNDKTGAGSHDVHANTACDGSDSTIKPRKSVAQEKLCGPPIIFASF